MGQELLEEGIVGSLEPFVRFLSVAGEYKVKYRDLFYYAVRSAGDVELVIQMEKKTKIY